MPGPRMIVCATALAVCAFSTAAVATPVPAGPPTSLPEFTGAVAPAKPLAATIAPRHPFMARNPFSNIHNDPWMTDAYQSAGPLGRNLQATSGAHPPSLCGSLAFDRKGRIVSVCPRIGAGPQARIYDPSTLILAAYDLPDAPVPAGTPAFQNFAGGGYFFLDERDRIWSATKTRHVFVLDDRLVKVADYDLSRAVARDDQITSVLPDWQGRVWFVSKRRGVVGVLDPRTRKVRTIRLGEAIQNSFAVDRDGIYIASDTRLYRFNAGKRNVPVVDWKVRYKNSGVHKPGQADAGTGTTPTLFSGGDLVTITDNADPMNVVVYRTAKTLAKGVKRTLCETPVFAKGASATENSIIAAGRSLFVENNHGYQDPTGPNAGAPTTPGFARIDVGKRGCVVAWTNTTAAAPSVVSKLSTKTGLIYTYIAPPDPNGSQPWFWAAIDAHTGREAWRKLAGTGIAFNNNYTGLALGPDGTAYLGTVGGLQALRDGADR